MPLAAIIRRQPHLSLSEWLGFVRSSPNLAKPKPRMRTNAFAKRRVPYQPLPGEVEVFDEGESLATIQPDQAFADNGELIVYTDKKPDLRTVRAISAMTEALGANVVWCYAESDKG